MLIFYKKIINYIKRFKFLTMYLMWFLHVHSQTFNLMFCIIMNITIRMPMV